MSNNKFSPDNKTRSSKSNGFKPWFKTKFIPKVAKIGNQRHLAAIRDSFGTMIPLIIAGSIGVLVNAIVFGGAGSGYVSLLGLFAKASHPELTWDGISKLLGDTTNGWGQTSKICGLAFGHMNTVTVGMMSIYFSFLFGYYISLSRGFQQPIIAGLVSTASFMLAGLGEIAFFMDAKGLIGAILFGIIATEAFVYLSSLRALNIKMPDGVPPAVGKSFAVFLPAVITLAGIGVLNIFVLAPAIITSNLTVTGNNQAQIATNLQEVEGLLDKVRGLTNTQIAELLKVDVDSPWIKDMFNNLTTEKFSQWYNSQGNDIKSLVAALFLNQGQNVSLGDFHHLNADNILNFGLDANGKIVALTGSYVSTKLGPTQFGLNAAIYQFFTSWFIGFATGSGGLGLAIVFVFFVGFFWFFGVHGSNLMAGVFEPIFWMVLGINTSLVNGLGYDVAAATGSMGVFTKPFFDSYMYVGGSGATLGLLIMTFGFSKRRELKEIAKYATPAGVFQINEPVIFGYPIVLNVVYIVPFIFAPILNLFIGWIFSPAVLGFVKYSYVAAPWTAPWFVSAIITSLDGKAIIPAMICFGVDLLFYLPFILLDNKLYFKKLKSNNPEKYELEKKYYSDKVYRYEVDTETKVKYLEEKSELMLMDAESQITFWSRRMTNKEKLEKRKVELMKKAQVKHDKYIEQSKKVAKARSEKLMALRNKKR